MIKNIEEKLKEIRETWLKHKDKMSAKDIFINHLKEYFEIKIPSKDWMYFVSRVRDWKKQEEIKEMNKQSGEMTDEEAEKLQDKNRKMSIILLNKSLERLQEDPAALTKVDVMEIRRLMKTIEGVDQARERTKIARGKLQLDAVKTFFPYQRMDSEELKQLKELFLNGIKELEQIESGEAGPDGQGIVSAG